MASFYCGSLSKNLSFFSMLLLAMAGKETGDLSLYPLLSLFKKKEKKQLQGNEDIKFKLKYFLHSGFLYGLFLVLEET